MSPSQSCHREDQMTPCNDIKGLRPTQKYYLISFSDASLDSFMRFKNVIPKIWLVS